MANFSPSTWKFIGPDTENKSLLYAGNLERLDAGACMKVADKDWRKLLNCCPRLQSLSMSKARSCPPASCFLPGPRGRPPHTALTKLSLTRCVIIAPNFWAVQRSHDAMPEHSIQRWFEHAVSLLCQAQIRPGT